eukprot:GEMP01028208.1.p1 GENE.GEMP01028208.1~~GEMP01028208.1.p1  ORF type:complete len:510 (+),score=106.42 GEMP01028208.1:52-1530(+)
MVINLVPNFIGGEFKVPEGVESLPVTSPSDGQVIANVPLCGEKEVDAAIQVAAAVSSKWKEQTVKARVQVMFKWKHLIEENIEEIARSISTENGKIYPEAKAEVMKGVETIEWACSLPQLIAGRILEVSRGVNCREVRDPVGIVASIVPFNFPCMVPMWTIPIALSCGNCVLLKPSEKVPLTMQICAKLLQQAGLPDGVFQIVNGGQKVVEAIADHPKIHAMTFVGSTPVARIVYNRAKQGNKRAICLGGAKNHMVCVPDCDVDMTLTDICNSAFGSTGQRCMAASVLLLIGEQDELMQKLIARAAALQPGQEAIGQVGPLIDKLAVDRNTRYINEAVTNGTKLLLDGRKWSERKGFWVGPTILLHASSQDAPMREEIFGPVLSVYVCKDFHEAIAIENGNPFGNAASIYTSTGLTADWFTGRFSAGMCGVNIGVPVPREPFSFGGMNDSKFGDGYDITGDGLMEFCTVRRKITTKWAPPKDQSLITQAFIS